jgi:serine/threonine protein kinase
MLFIAMRFIRGRDLAAVIAAEGRLEPLRAAKIVDQIADALDAAHEQGLVHDGLGCSTIARSYKQIAERALARSSGPR